MKTIQVKVRPNARVSALDGKANKELVALIARHFACPKSAVVIKSGKSGRMKWVNINK
jgi:uncharacterized protein